MESADAGQTRLSRGWWRLGRNVAETICVRQILRQDSFPWNFSDGHFRIIFLLRILTGDILIRLHDI